MQVAALRKELGAARKSSSKEGVVNSGAAAELKRIDAAVAGVRTAQVFKLYVKAVRYRTCTCAFTARRTPHTPHRTPCGRGGEGGGCCARSACDALVLPFCIVAQLCVRTTALRTYL